MYGDGNLIKNYPDLQDAPVWVYFHSNIPEFNKVECWGPLREASAPRHEKENDTNILEFDTALKPCEESCACCFPPMSLIPWPNSNLATNGIDDYAPTEGLENGSTTTS